MQEEHRALSNKDQSRQSQARMEKIEEYLDRGIGSALLKQEAFASIVQSALLHFAGERYLLHAWVIMPNHVHALMTPFSGRDVCNIVHSWKSFGSNKINLFHRYWRCSTVWMPAGSRRRQCDADHLIIWRQP